MTALLQKATSAQPQGLHQAHGTIAGGSPIKGIAVPVKIKIGNGSLRTYVALGADAVASQAAFQAALDVVERIVGPLDIYESREDSGLGGGRGYGNRGWYRR